MLLSEMFAGEVWPWNLSGHDFPLLWAAQTPISLFKDGIRCCLLSIAMMHFVARRN